MADRGSFLDEMATRRERSSQVPKITAGSYRMISSSPILTTRAGDHGRKPFDKQAYKLSLLKDLESKSRRKANPPGAVSLAGADENINPNRARRDSREPDSPRHVRVGGSPPRVYHSPPSPPRLAQGSHYRPADEPGRSTLGEHGADIDNNLNKLIDRGLSELHIPVVDLPESSSAQTKDKVKLLRMLMLELSTIRSDYEQFKKRALGYKEQYDEERERVAHLADVNSDLAEQCSGLQAKVGFLNSRVKELEDAAVDNAAAEMVGRVLRVKLKQAVRRGSLARAFREWRDAATSGRALQVSALAMSKAEADEKLEAAAAELAELRGRAEELERENVILHKDLGAAQDAREIERENGVLREKVERLSRALEDREEEIIRIEEEKSGMVPHEELQGLMKDYKDKLIGGVDRFLAVKRHRDEVNGAFVQMRTMTAAMKGLRDAMKKTKKQHKKVLETHETARAGFSVWRTRLQRRRKKALERRLDDVSREIVRLQEERDTAAISAEQHRSNLQKLLRELDDTGYSSVGSSASMLSQNRSAPSIADSDNSSLLSVASARPDARRGRDFDPGLSPVLSPATPGIPSGLSPEPIRGDHHASPLTLHVSPVSTINMSPQSPAAAPMSPVFNDAMRGDLTRRIREVPGAAPRASPSRTASLHERFLSRQPSPGPGGKPPSIFGGESYRLTPERSGLASMPAGPQDVHDKILAAREKSAGFFQELHLSPRERAARSPPRQPPGPGGGGGGAAMSMISRTLEDVMAQFG